MTTLPTSTTPHSFYLEYICIKELIPLPTLKEFVNSLQLETISDSPSKLYHRFSRETLTDVTRRPSREIDFRTPTLFEWVENKKGDYQ